MIRRKVLLIIPPSGAFLREDRCQSPIEKEAITFLRPPMILAYAAAIFEREGAECRIVDFPAEKASWVRLNTELKEFNPDILFINTTSPTIVIDMQACEKAKKYNSKILTVVKGAYAFTHDKQMLESFKDLDAVYRSEIDDSIVGLLGDHTTAPGITYRKEAQIVKNEVKGFQDLNELPFPARHLLKNDLYLRPDVIKTQTVIQTARGCPSRCKFCVTEKVSGLKIRQRSPENIVKEIKECIQKYHIEYFFFAADTFTYVKPWVIKLCKLIIEENLKITWGCNGRASNFDDEMAGFMKKAGCDVIGFGIESGNEEMLRRMNKGITLQQARDAVNICKKHGIKAYCFFIIGFPWDTYQTMEETINLAIELDPDFAEFLKFRLIPGTDFFEEAKEIKIDRGKFKEPGLKHFYLKPGDLDRYYKKAVFRFHMRPRYILRTLKNTGSPKELFTYIIEGVAKLYNLIIKK